MRALIASIWLLLSFTSVVSETAIAQRPMPYYYANGQRISLEISSSRSAAGLHPQGVLARQMQQIGTETVSIGGQWITILPVPYSNARTALTAIPSEYIRWIAPIYSAGTVELIATDEIIVSYFPNTPLPQVNQLNAAYHTDRIRKLGGSNTWLLRVPPGTDPLQIANAYQESGQVIAAEPNFTQIFEPLTPPDDPLFLQQWHLENTGQISGAVPGADIDALTAWETQTGSGVIVAVLDEGVDLTHPDLAGKIISPFDPYEAEAGIQPKPWDSHGTAVAGIVAASTNNTTGIAGVCPDCQIMPIRIFYRPTQSSASLFGTTANVAAGIDHAWQNGAAILNNSWGGSPSSAISSALERALSKGRGGLGSLVVAAAGNNFNGSLVYPASFPGVVAVTATNLCDALKTPVADACNAGEGWGSTHGNGIDIAAPGVAITTTDNTGPNGSDPGDYRGNFFGTSAATPIVSGVAALIMADQPGFTAGQVEQQIYASSEDVNSATKPGYDTDIGWGRVNAAQSLIQWRVQTGYGPGTTWERDPAFTWQHVTTVNDVSAYRLVIRDIAGQLVSDRIFDADTICQEGACTARAELTLAVGTYPWELYTISNSLGSSIASDTQVMNIAGPVPNDPQGLRTDINGDPTFTWNTISGPSWYQLVVRSGANLTFSIWQEAEEICQPHPGTCSLNPVALDPEYMLVNGTYSWTVRGWGSTGGYGAFALDQNFILNAPPPELVQFDSPALSDTDTLRPSFHFIAPDGAAYFRLALTESGKSVWDKWFDRTSACGAYTATSCTVVVPFELKDNLSYRLFVRAWGPGGFTSSTGTPGEYVGWQGPLSFTIDVPAANPPANLSTSVDNVDVTFHWDDDPQATWFQLIVSDTKLNKAIHANWYEKNQSLLNCNAGSCSVLPRITFNSRVYTWKVRGWGPGGMSVYTAGPNIDFTGIQAPDVPDVGSFATFTGEVHTDLDQINYQWDDVERASWFRLVIADMNGNLKLDQWYMHMDICEEGVCTVGPQGRVDPGLVLTNGNHQWGVLAWGPGGTSPRPEAALFTIGGQPPIAPDLSDASPSGTITTGNPNFGWTAPSGATNYDLYVGHAAGGKVVLKNLSAIQLGCSNTPGSTCTAGADDIGSLNLANGDYEWYLRASGPGGTSLWSAGLSFSVQIPPPGGTAVLLSPIDDAVVTDSVVAFDWQATSETTWYRHRLYDEAMNLVNEKWLLAGSLGCASGGTCQWEMNVQPGRYLWTVSIYGPGTVDMDYQESDPATFELLLSE